MKTRKYVLLIWILLLTGNLSAQNELNYKLLKINKKIDSVLRQKSQQFEAELQRIDQQLQHKKITPEEAETEKKRLAKQYAEDLDYAIYKLTSDLKKISKGTHVTDTTINNRTAYKIRKIRFYRKSYYDKCPEKHKNTYAYLFLSTGLNNVISDDKINSIESSPYGYIQSRFFETGIDWKTNFVHEKVFLVYGFSFVWNTLKPTGNRYHVLTNDTVNIIPYPYDLERSKLRHIWLRLPISLEINIPDSNHNHLSASAGIYGKFKLTTKQKLTYFANGNSHDEILKNDYTIPYFAYGIKGSIGGTNWHIYADYDITPLFKKEHKHLISLGVKWRL